MEGLFLFTLQHECSSNLSTAPPFTPHLKIIEHDIYIYICICICIWYLHNNNIYIYTVHVCLLAESLLESKTQRGTFGAHLVRCWTENARVFHLYIRWPKGTTSKHSYDMIHIYIVIKLVGGWANPLKNMSSSIGMMRFPIYGKT